MTNNSAEQPVTVRFPVDLHRRIKALAVRDLRSFNAEVVWLLTTAVAQAEGERS